MFDFMDMMGTYDLRKVDRYEEDGLIISTASVPDSDWDYETAVSHLSYNNGDWIIVEGYETKEQAEKGHSMWIKKMTGDLPDTLKDISTAEIMKFLLMIDPDTQTEYEKDSELTRS